MVPLWDAQRNPLFLLSDTSALVQLTAVDCIAILRKLKSDYGVQSVIVESVEMELRRNVKKAKFLDSEHHLTKALDSKAITVLDEGFVEREKLGNTFLDELEALAKTYQSLGCHDGESYTHAAATLLGMPTLTNDVSAVKVLKNGGAIIPEFLRSFDIITFALQIGQMSEHECDEARALLVKKQETIEKVFRNRSFRDALQFFYPRLVDRDCSAIGCQNPANAYDGYRLTIFKI